MKNKKNTKNLPKWGAAVMANFANLHKEAEAKKKAEALKLQEKFAKMSEQEFWDLEKNV
tara:strand:+ start:188 stop:364 length:177 start_codon:yes stop_codon:yes gene_type:complete